MAQLELPGLWRRSFLGRLLALVLESWEDSFVGRSLAGLGRFGGRVFAGSLLGKALLSDWPEGPRAGRSAAGRLFRSIGAVDEAVGRRVGPFFARTWESSLFARMFRTVVNRAAPYAETSLLFQALSGFSGTVRPASGETAESRPASIEILLLGLLLGLVPLVPSEFSGVLSPTVLTVLGVWAVSALWLVRRWACGQLSWRWSASFVPLGAFLAVAAAATVQSVDRSSSMLSLAIWATSLLLFTMVVNLVRTSRQAAALLGPVLCGAALMAVWGVYQFFFPPVIEEAWVDPTTSGQLTRVFASMGNPNYLAEYMALWLPLGIALWFQQSRHRLELAGLLGAMVVGLILTYSRGGWLAFLVSVGVFVLLRARKLTPLLFLGAVAVPLVAPESILRRLVSAFTLQDTSNAYRLNLWKGVQAMLEKFWFLGSGLGADAFAKVYSEFMLPAARAAHAHNTYLQIFAEMGILGLIAIVWSLGVVLRRPAVLGSDPRSPLLMAAVPAAISGLLFHGLVEHIWYNPKLLFAFWAVAGIGVGLALGVKEGRAS